MAKGKAEMKKKAADKVVTEETAAAASIAAKPLDKLGAINGAVNLLGILPQDMALNAFDAMIKSIGQEAAPIPDGATAANQASIQMKGAALQEAITEAVNDIFAGEEGLSDEFKTKTVALFESALGVRLGIERAVIEEEVQAKAQESIDEAVANLHEMANEYLTYVAEQWLEANQVAVESTLRTEITESFIADLKTVCESHYMTFPDDKADIVEDLAAKVEELTNKLNDVVNENIEMSNVLAELEKEAVIDTVAEGLALTQQEKFRTLVEGVEFDPENYEAKLQVIRDKHFPDKATKPSNILSEEVTPEEQTVKATPAMDKYLKAAAHLNKVVS